MPHIHTLPNQHDHTVTAYIVRTDGDEPRILLHMHKKLGMLLPVGGHIELDETPWAAMAHEIEEESGYALDQLKVLQPTLRLTQADYREIIIHPQPFIMNTHSVSSDADHFHSDTAYIFVANEDPRNTLSSDESHDLRWLTRKQVAALGTDEEIWLNTQYTCQVIFNDFLHEWQMVPTAEFRLDKNV